MKLFPVRAVKLAAYLAMACWAYAAATPDTIYAPLRLYEGTWRITRKDLGPGAKPDELKNDCALVGKFFACQQTVNGTPGPLLIFLPIPNQPGHYHTQNVNQEARASGIGDLEISGDHWVFSSRWDQGGGKTTYYRTINQFSGKTHIHFEQQESSNGKDWTVKNSGDEVRVSGPGR